MALAALIRGLSYRQAATVAGCGVRTLFDWRRRPAFATALREAIEGIRSAAFDRAAASSVEGVLGLVDISTGRRRVGIWPYLFAVRAHGELVGLIPPGEEAAKIRVLHLERTVRTLEERVAGLEREGPPA